MNYKMAVARLVGLSDNDIYFLKSLRHSWWLWKIHKLPLSRFEFPALPPLDHADREIAARIIAFYRRTSGEEGQRSPMWERNLSGVQAPLVHALRRGDEEALANLLRGMLRNSIVQGIDAGSSYMTGNWRVHSLKLLDGLVSLAEQVGAAKAEFSQGRAAEALADGVEPLVEAIEARLGRKIGVPNVGGPYGLRAGDQLLTLNSAEYVRMAWRAKLAAPAGPLTVVEIGAGYGAMAFWLMQMTDVERYAIVDLPEIGCLQAYYLSRCFGSDSVSLFGETRDAQVRILPPHALETAGKPTLVINQDSLPEIPLEAARRYVAWVRDNLEGVFFSCNHETLVTGFAVTLVPELVVEVGGLERIRRDLCWSRPGYVEEVYVPMKP